MEDPARAAVSVGLHVAQTVSLAGKCGDAAALGEPKS